MQETHRVSATDRAGAFIAKQLVEQTRLKAGRVGKTQERREVVPIILVKANAGIATDEVQGCTRRRLTTRSRRRFKEIACTRDAPYRIKIRWLNGQTIWNGRNAHVVPTHAITQRKVTLHTPLVLGEERQVFPLDQPFARVARHKTRSRSSDV